MRSKRKTKGIFVKTDEEVMRMADTLRVKNCVNVSQLVRTAIVDAYKRLNLKEEIK